MNLEQQLREALRPRDPGEDFTATVMARIPVDANVPLPRKGLARRRSYWSFALAASVLLAFFGTQQFLQNRQRERAFAAHVQLEQALAITSAELQQLQQRLNPAE
jgi:uncharacterized protein YlxW (UPF0749 family)